MKEQTPELSVVILTKNEADNLRSLLPEIRSTLDPSGIRYELMAVDAWSTDGTQELVEAAQGRVVTQSSPRYSAAMEDAFKEARADFMVVMDADGPHPPEAILRMWRQRGEADVVVGSRYVSGGGSKQEWNRWILSRLLNICYGFALRIPIRDLSGSFRLYRSKNVRSMKIDAKGVDVQEEILVRLFRRGLRIREVPFTYRKREEGESKMPILRSGYTLLKSLIRLSRESGKSR